MLFIEPPLTPVYTSINSVLTDLKDFQPCAWIPRTGTVFWNQSAKLEYVDALPCERFTLVLVGLDRLRLPWTTRKGEVANAWTRNRR